MKLGTIAWTCLGLLALAILYLVVLICSGPAFAYRYTYRGFDISSDRPIDRRIEGVIDAIRRLSTSELYRPGERFNVHICNSTWRLWLYSQTFSDRMGGVADTWLTRNIYIRPADIARNRIVSPGPREISDVEHRPLSYFIAHEATHHGVARLRSPRGRHAPKAHGGGQPARLVLPG